MFTFSVMSLRNNIKYNDKDVTIAEKEVFNNLTTAARMYAQLHWTLHPDFESLGFLEAFKIAVISNNICSIPQYERYMTFANHSKVS